jgi:hypothetical protein
MEVGRHHSISLIQTALIESGFDLWIVSDLLVLQNGFCAERLLRETKDGHGFSGRFVACFSRTVPRESCSGILTVQS